MCTRINTPFKSSGWKTPLLVDDLIIIDMILQIYRDKQWFVADFPGAIFSSMLGMILIDLGSEHYADDMYPGFEYHSLQRSREHVKTVSSKVFCRSFFTLSHPTLS